MTALRQSLAALILVGGSLLCAAHSPAAVTQALWIFPSAAAPNPVTDATARQTLVNNAIASGVGIFYVSVYSSTPNAAGRYMNEEPGIAALIAAIHAKAGKVYAAYGAPDWPSLGCSPSSFPLQRMAEISAYNADNPTAKFDGVVLDTEPPEPQTTTDFQSLLNQYQAIHDALPADVALAVVIRFFWDNVIEYPAGSGVMKPVYAHVIGLDLSNVVLLGYRDFAGTADVDSGGMIFLDQDEIAYAGSIGKRDLVLAGLETTDPATTGVSNKETFFEEGQGTMNFAAQAVLDHFGILRGLGGFAVHNYQNSYLSGVSSAWPLTNPGFPVASHEARVNMTARLTNGHAHLHGTGIPGRTYQVEASRDLSPGSFMLLGTVTPDTTGAFDFDDATAVGEAKRFYLLVFADGAAPGARVRRAKTLRAISIH